jgi:hypothetical protein
MTPLPQSKLRNIAPLIEAFIRESSCSDRTSVEHCLERLAQGYLCQNMDAYVDDPDAPRKVIIFGRYPGLAVKEELICINFVYAVEEDRLKPETVAAFREVIEKYAEAHPRDSILASSWVYRGSRGIDAFWRHLGFEKQEVIYVKRLKEVKHG